MSEDVQPPEVKKRAPTLYLIIGFKLLKGTLALLIALGIYSLTDNNLPEEFKSLLKYLHRDPEKQFYVNLAKRVAEITPANLQWVAAGVVFYSLFMLMQAIGLIFRVSWIVWLVIGESAFFVPIELYELVHRPNWIKFGILAANVFIVWYLFANRHRLIRHHHH